MHECGGGCISERKSFKRENRLTAELSFLFSPAPASLKLHRHAIRAGGYFLQGGDMSRDELIVSASLLERLAEIMPASYAHLLLYLVAKTRERGQDWIQVTQAGLSSVVGLTRDSLRRAFIRLVELGFISEEIRNRRTIIHVYNLTQKLELVNDAHIDRPDTAPIPPRYRTLEKEESNPKKKETLSLFDNLTATSTAETPSVGSPKPPKSKSKRFEKPSVFEVVDYAKSISFILDGEEFVDHYESKGWMIGKSPMKDWKAAVRTWKKAAKPGQIVKPKPPAKPPEVIPKKEDLVSADDVHDLVMKLAGGKALGR